MLLSRRGSEGAQAHDFLLPDQLGKTMRLTLLLKDGTVVLLFYRGAWCPYCHLALLAYQQALPPLWQSPRKRPDTASPWPKSWT